MRTANTSLAGAAFASKSQMGLVRRQNTKPMKLQPNAVFALAFLLLPLVLVMTLGGEQAEANAAANNTIVLSTGG